MRNGVRAVRYRVPRPLGRVRDQQEGKLGLKSKEQTVSRSIYSPLAFNNSKRYVLAIAAKYSTALV